MQSKPVPNPDGLYHYIISRTPEKFSLENLLVSKIYHTFAVE